MDFLALLLKFLHRYFEVGDWVIPSMAILSFIRFRFWKRRLPLATWLGCLLVVLVGWRFAATASFVATGHRYYGLIAILLLFLALPGIIYVVWTARLLKIKKEWIWPAMIIAILAVNISLSLHEKQQKTFIPAAASKIRALTAADPKEEVILLDATAEHLRLAEFLDLEILPLDKITSEFTSAWQNNFWNHLNQTLPHRQRIFFLTRVLTADPAIREYLERGVPMRLLASYQYRTYDYLLYEIDRPAIYSPAMEDFIRRRTGDLAADPVLTVPAGQEIRIPYRDIFPVERLEEWRVEVDGNCGIWQPESWSYQAPENDDDQNREVTFRLLNRKGFELMRQRLRLTATASGDSTPAPTFYRGNPEPLADFPPEAESRTAIPLPSSRAVPQPLRIMFFGSYYASVPLTDLTDQLAIQIVNTDNKAEVEKVWHYSQSYQNLLNGRTAIHSQPYWIDSKLVLAAGKEIDMVFLMLGSGELIHFSEAETRFGKRLDDLLADLAELLTEIRRQRPDVRLVLGTEPEGEPVALPVNSPLQYYPYRQAAGQFNRELIRRFGSREGEGIFLADLTTDLKTPAAYRRTPQTMEQIRLSPAGEKILLANLYRFLKSLGVPEKSDQPE